MKQSFSGSISGRARVIVDGDNIGAREYGPGSFSLSYTKSIEIRDLEAPENQGGGSAQPTGGNVDGAPGTGS